MRKLVLIRRSSQIFFLSLFVYLIWLTAHPIVYIPWPLYAAMLILTLVLGRYFCGWVCPLGAIIDICGIKAKNRDLDFRQVKYFILIGIIVFAFLGVQIEWIFDPLVITGRFVSLNFIPFITLILDRFFIFLIKSLNFYSPLYDFYRSLKTSLLGAKIYYFPHSYITLSYIIVICCFVLFTKRFWCRVICPVGAAYSLFARFSVLRRRVDKCTNCMKCAANCRMSAIRKDMSYRSGECILCMDCVYECPVHGTRFAWPAKELKGRSNDAISRKDFLFLIASSVFLLGFKGEGGGSGKKLIRPPGVNDEKKFLNKCIRCANCMRVCPTNGLHPVIFESGLAGIWTPRLVPEIGYCEYNCNMCGNVCPTGAIPKLALEQKKEQKLGLAYIDRNICIPWLENRECIVCEEHCPVPSKAIKVYEEEFNGKRIKKPYVDNSLCIGCGICQNKCPTRPDRAIRISP